MYASLQEETGKSEGNREREAPAHAQQDCSRVFPRRRLGGGSEEGGHKYRREGRPR